MRISSKGILKVKWILEVTWPELYSSRCYTSKTPWLLSIIFEYADATFYLGLNYHRMALLPVDEGAISKFSLTMQVQHKSTDNQEQHLN